MTITKKTKILVVDDDTDIVVLISSFLAEEGFKVYTTTRPTQAIEYVQNYPVDLAIIDIALPEMNGIELLKKLKEIKPNIEAIMITAYKDAEKVVEAFRLGAFDCIFKPFNLQYLRKAIMAKMCE
ncbi:MAG: response regulator [Elusimicrobiota bacterium]|nr:response regulator [Endomicrobiia bacterium]MDW8166205.1 response regulator [Elusimicrobiota bacterium]